MKIDADVVEKREFLQEQDASSRFVLIAASTAGLTLLVLVVAIFVVSWIRNTRRADEERASQLAAINDGRAAFNEGKRRFDAPIGEYYEHWQEGWENAAEEKRVAELNAQRKAEDARRKAEESRQKAQAAREAEQRRIEKQRQAELEKARRREIWLQAKQKLKDTYYKSSRWDYHLSEMRDAADMLNSEADPDVRDFVLKFLTSQKSLIAKEEYPYVSDIVASAGITSWTEWKQLDDEAELESW